MLTFPMFPIHSKSSSDEKVSILQIRALQIEECVGVTGKSSIWDGFAVSPWNGAAEAGVSLIKRCYCARMKTFDKL